MIFQKEMHLKYCEKGSLVIFLIIKGHCSTHLSLFHGRSSGLCLGESNVAEKSFKKLPGVKRDREITQYIAKQSLKIHC